MDAAYNIGTAEKLGKDYSPGVAGKILSGAPGTVQTDNSVISYAPIHTGDEVVNDYWVLAIVYPKKYILGSVWKLEMVFAVLGILSVGIATGIGLWTAKRYTGPILELHQGVEWIAAGDFDHMLRISTGDEIEDLAKRFNEMAGRLKIAKEEMEKWNLKLAHEVSVRSRELVRERNKFESVIMSAEEGIIVADENDGITIVNPRAETIMKAHKADLIGKNLYGYYKDIENTQLVKGEVKDASAPRTAVIGSLLIETSWAVIGNRGEKAGTMVVMRDISERQRLMEERLTMERQLLLADKLVSIGELASGIAHEIGNPLAGIKAVIQAMSEERAFSGVEKKYFDRILSEVNRLTAFLKTFTDYTNPWMSESPKGWIEPVLKDISFFMTKEASRRGVELYFGQENGVPEIMMDAMHIKQIITNLVLNAMQAMRNGGKISVLAAPAPSGDQNAVISVSDNGPGIPPEIINKIFDPFFTTKPEGTGLGLSIVQRIVKDHHGEIRVTSQPGIGTTFEITIPAIKQIKPQNAGRGN
jgi:two-component system sensor histidine kinase AtoS